MSYKAVLVNGLTYVSGSGSKYRHGMVVQVPEKEYKLLKYNSRFQCYEDEEPSKPEQPLPTPVRELSEEEVEEIAEDFELEGPKLSVEPTEEMIRLASLPIDGLKKDLLLDMAITIKAVESREQAIAMKREELKSAVKLQQSAILNR